MIAPARLGPYRLLHALGSGGFGTVYSAIDERSGSAVALKLLNKVHPQGIASLKREFRALAEFRHGNLVRLFELGFEKDTWFFTMELVAGTDLLTFIRDGATRQPHLARLRMVFAQLALALDATHRGGLLHLDVKPSNVLVSEEGRLVLLDFGLVEHLRIPTSTLHRRVQGTPAYMAPEQVLGDALSEATDWYAFGGILYEALNGAVAHTSSDPIVLLHRKLHEPVPPISSRSGAVSRDLSALAEALLAREPEKRPAAGQILRSLQLGQSQRAPAEPSLVGRDKEWNALHRALAQASSGRVLVMLSGRSGLGKTSIVERFVAEQRDNPEALLFFSRCHQHAHIPFRALDGCVDDLADHLAKLGRREQSEIRVSDLVRVFPTLDRTEIFSAHAREAFEIVPDAEARRRALLEMTQVLDELAQGRTLVFVFDDLHWGDKDSERLLSEILREERLPRILLLACFRSDLAPGPIVEALQDSAHGDSPLAITRLELEPLSEEHSIELARLQLGTDQLERARALAQRSGGVPLLLEELVSRELAEGELTSSSSPDEESDLEHLLLGRLARLPAVSRAIVELSAIAHRPLPPEVACAALKLEIDAEFVESTSSLKRYRLLRPGNSLEPYHLATRECVLSQIHPTTLQARHLALAQAYEARGSEDKAILSEHYRAGGDTHRAGTYAAKAAEGAAQVLAFVQAIELYQLAIFDLAEFEPERIDGLRRALAAALANAGQGREAAETYLACQARDRQDCHYLRSSAAVYYLTSGELEKGTEVYNQLLKDNGVSIPQTRAGILSTLVVHLAWARLRGTKYKIRPDEEICPEVRSQIDLLVVGYRGYSTFRPLLTGALALMALKKSLAVGYQRGIINTLDYYGLMGAYSGKPADEKRAFAILDEVALLAKSFDDALLRSRSGLGHGVAYTAIGDFAASVKELDAISPRLEQCPGAVWELSVIENTRVQALIWMGDFKRARQCVSVLRRRSEQAGDRFSTLTGAILGAKLTLADGRPDAARAQLEAALRLWTTREYTFQRFFALKAQVWCDLYQGKPQAGLELYLKEEPALKRSGLLSLQLMQAERLYLRGVIELACARDSSHQVPRRVSQMAAQLDAMARPYTHGYAATLRTGNSLLKGEQDRARGHGNRACEHFATAAMKGHAAAVHLSLGDSTQAEFFHGQGIAAPANWMRIYQPIAFE